MMQFKCKDLSIGHEQKSVLSDLNFEINSGDYFCIIGENGSGKSTLFDTLLGLISPISGELIRNKKLSLKDIGYLPQQTAVQRDFPASVSEIVMSGFQGKMGLRPYYLKKEKEHAREIMQKLRIDSLAGKCYRHLSGGQQQRVLLARALCASDKMLFLDEPVSGLDPGATADMYDIINELNKKYGVTIVMISHDIQAVMKYATCVLRVGQNSFYGTGREFVLSSGRKPADVYCDTCGKIDYRKRGEIK